MSADTVRRALTALADDLDGDRAAAARFARSWLGLLPARVDGLVTAQRAGDAGSARAVLLTLGCTSRMLGVDELAAESARALATLDEAGRVTEPDVRAVVAHTRRARDLVRAVLDRDERVQSRGSNR
ncbi:hypothetical protein IF650_15420 [Cellulosimicrobium terreum]|nr:hypothetical protein [Cellulosimicrobium terreum]